MDICFKGAAAAKSPQQQQPPEPSSVSSSLKDVEFLPVVPAGSADMRAQQQLRAALEQQVHPTLAGTEALVINFDCIGGQHTVQACLACLWL